MGCLPSRMRFSRERFAWTCCQTGSRSTKLPPETVSEGGRSPSPNRHDGNLARVLARRHDEVTQLQFIGRSGAGADRAHDLQRSRSCWRWNWLGLPPTVYGEYSSQRLKIRVNTAILRFWVGVLFAG